MTILNAPTLKEWLGFKPGDLLETKKPIFLHRVNERWRANAGLEPSYILKYAPCAYRTNFTDMSERRPLGQDGFIEPEVYPADDPWLLKAEESGWVEVDAPEAWVHHEAEIGKLVGLITSVDFDGEGDVVVKANVNGQIVELMPEGLHSGIYFNAVAPSDLKDLIQNWRDEDKEDDEVEDLPKTKEEALEAWEWCVASRAERTETING